MSGMSSGEAAAVAQAEQRVRGNLIRAQAALERARGSLMYPEPSERGNAAAMEALRRRRDAAEQELRAAQAALAALERFEVDRQAVSDERRAREQSDENGSDGFPSSGSSGSEDTDMTQGPSSPGARDPTWDGFPSGDSGTTPISRTERGAQGRGWSAADLDPSNEAAMAQQRASMARPVSRAPSAAGDGAAAAASRNQQSRARLHTMDRALDRGTDGDREPGDDGGSDRERERARGGYDAAVDNVNNVPPTNQLDEVSKEFERLMYDKASVYRLCWSDDKTTRQYITVPEAREAFNDARAIVVGDGIRNVQGVTKKTTIRDFKVVIKKHYGGREAAYLEDQNHRFVWNSLVMRGYEDLAAMLSVPACMDWTQGGNGNPGRPEYYTVQTLVGWDMEERDVDLSTLHHFIRDKGVRGSNDATMEVRMDLARQYARATAAFHSAGVFHNDLHWENMLVLWDPIFEVAKLRFIDWGMGSNRAHDVLMDGDNNPMYCEYTFLNGIDKGFIVEDLAYRHPGANRRDSSKLKEFGPRGGVMIQENERSHLPENDYVQRDLQDSYPTEDGRRELYPPGEGGRARYCLGERILGPWALWMDLDDNKKQELRAYMVEEYRTFLRMEGARMNRTASQIARSLAVARGWATRRAREAAEAEAAQALFNRRSEAAQRGAQTRARNRERRAAEEAAAAAARFEARSAAANRGWDTRRAREANEEEGRGWAAVRRERLARARAERMSRVSEGEEEENGGGLCTVM